LIKEVLKL